MLVEYPDGGLAAKETADEDTHDLSYHSEDSDIEDEDDDEEEGDEDDSSYDSDSSSEHSLGSIIAKMGYEVPMDPPIRPLKRVNSMPNAMQLESQPDQANLSAEHRRSFSNFMSRMNNCNSGYFQAAPPPASKAPITRQKAKSTTTLDEINKSTNSQDSNSPANYFKEEIAKGLVPEGFAFPESFWKTYFLPITQERIDGYTHEAVGAIRSLDVATLRKIAEERGDSAMDACSRQGESLLHVACRRGNEEVFRFLVEEAEASIKVRDDWNKTTLHDLCWGYKAGHIAQFELVRIAVSGAPELLFAKDKRGFLALQYVPKDAWADWCRFLMKEKNFLRAHIRVMMSQKDA